MARTLNGKALNITGFEEFLDAVTIEWDKWENEIYTKQVTVLGSIRKYTLQCFEDSISWPSSDVKHF